MSVNDLCKINGIGQAKSITIITALELGRRKTLEKIHEKEIIQSSKDIFNSISPFLSDLIEEQFWVIYLNHRLQILKKKMISSGGFTQTLVDIRKIFKYALEENATKIILSHNHPTGNLKPSMADINLTKKIIQAGQIIDIEVLDHLIITQNKYLSFLDEGMV